MDCNEDKAPLTDSKPKTYKNLKSSYVEIPAAPPDLPGEPKLIRMIRSRGGAVVTAYRYLVSGRIAYFALSFIIPDCSA